MTDNVITAVLFSGASLAVGWCIGFTRGMRSMQKFALKSILNKECIDFPGLVVSDTHDRKARKHTRTFYVQGDEREFSTIQDAAKAWNDQRRSAPAAAPEQPA